METSRALSICVPVIVLMLSTFVLGCRPGLEGSPDGAGGGGGGGGAAIVWSLEPSAPPDRAPPSLRIRLRADPPVDPGRVHFVRGSLGPGHLRQLAAGAPSNALQERFLAATIWRDGEDVVVAPHATLEPGEVYGVADADRGTSLELVAANLAPGVSWLERTWPLPEEQAWTPLAVLCGALELPPFMLALELAPSGHPATVARGVTSNGAGRRCLRVVSSTPAMPGAVLLLPPALALEGAQVALDPAPIVLGGPVPPELEPLLCEPSEIAVGPGCARVFDDRALVRAPPRRTLWAASGVALDVVAITEPGESFALHPLRPASENAVAIGAVDVFGRETTIDLVLHTTPPMPHVVLNEMLADCVGAEPACEWIEIVNDGTVAADLGELRIVDVGGEVLLPRVELPPGAFALVVGESYEPDAALDPVPAAGVLLLRVSRLGKGGLANAGELIRLMDAESRVLSAIPPVPSEEPGMSTARRLPSLADARSSFVAAAPTPGAPNGPL